MDIKMQDRTYYVAEVSFRESNPVHRAICFHRHDGFVYLYSAGYDGEESHDFKNLHHFKVISEIEDMNKK